MNHLDDFLKQKLGNTEAESVSGWAALEQAIPAQKTSGVAFKWAMIVLLAGITASTVYFFGSHSPETATQPLKEQTQSLETAAVNPVQELPVTDNSAAVKNETTTQPAVTTTRTRTAKEAHPFGFVKKESTPPVVNENPSSTKPAERTEPADHENNAPVVAVSPEKESGKEEVTANPNKENEVIAVTQPDKAGKVTVRKPKKEDFQKGKLYVNASFSPMMSYRNWQLNNGYAPYVHKQFNDIRESSDKMILSFATGLSMEYRFNRAFSLQSGLYYQMLGYRSAYDYEVADEATLDGSGRVTGYTAKSSNLLVSANKVSRFTSLRIPLILNYNIMITPATYFHLSAGPGFNEIIGVKSTGVDPVTLQLKDYTISSFKRFSNDLYMSLGFNTAISPKLGFVIDMFYDQWLTDISKSAYEKNLPFTAGFNVAIHRKIF